MQDSIVLHLHDLHISHPCQTVLIQRLSELPPHSLVAGSKHPPASHPLLETDYERAHAPRTDAAKRSNLGGVEALLMKSEYQKRTCVHDLLALVSRQNQTSGYFGTLSNVSFFPMLFGFPDAE